MMQDTGRETQLPTTGQPRVRDRAQIARAGTPDDRRAELIEASELELGGTVGAAVGERDDATQHPRPPSFERTIADARERQLTVLVGAREHPLVHDRERLVEQVRAQ
jgi:hypothetical protein